MIARVKIMRWIEKITPAVLLSLVLFLSLVPPSWCQSAAPGAGTYSDYLDVKAYRLRLSWNIGDSWVRPEQKENCVTVHTFSGGVNVGVSLKLVLKKVSRGGIYQWRVEKGSLPEGNIHYDFYYKIDDGCTSPPSHYKSFTIGNGITDGGGRLDIDSRTGEYIMHGYVTAGKTTVGDSVLGARELATGVTFGPISGAIPIDIKGTLPGGGQILRGSSLDQPCPLNWNAYCKKPMAFKWSLEPWEKEKPLEVWVDAEDYEDWIPEGNMDSPEKQGNKITLTARLMEGGEPADPKKRKADIQFVFTEVSHEKGICMNWPAPNAAKADDGLRILQDENKNLDVKSQLEAATFSPVTETKLVVSSFDYGAWGVLKIKAKDQGGKELDIKVHGKAGSEMKIPIDEDKNHIADSWKPEESKGKSKEWDSETIEGQKNDGDGITLFDEYRGVVVQTGKGGREFTRLSPKTKEMFVLDADNIFPDAKWEEVTGGFKTYRMNESLVEPAKDPTAGAKVNFNAPESGAHPVYTRKIVSRTDNPSDNPSPGFTEDHTINIFSARIQSRIQDDFVWLNTAILKPESLEGQELKEQGPAAQITYDDAYRAWTILTDSNQLSAVSAKLKTVIVLHEMGHACGLTGVDHGVEKEVGGQKVSDPTPKGQEDLARSCLMFNQAKWGRRRTLVHTALGRGVAGLAYPYRNFCREVQAPGYECFKSLKMKEW